MKFRVIRTTLQVFRDFLYPKSTYYEVTCWGFKEGSLIAITSVASKFWLGGFDIWGRLARRPHATLRNVKKNLVGYLRNRTRDVVRPKTHSSSLGHGANPWQHHRCVFYFWKWGGFPRPNGRRAADFVGLKSQFESFISMGRGVETKCDLKQRISSLRIHPPPESAKFIV